MRYVAKTLEAIGIVLAGFGLIFGFRGSMGKELTYAFIGALIFFIGWFIENKVMKNK